MFVQSRSRAKLATVAGTLALFALTVLDVSSANARTRRTPTRRPVRPTTTTAAPFPPVAAGNRCAIPGEHASANLDCVDLPGGALWQIPGTRLNPIRFGRPFTFQQSETLENTRNHVWTLQANSLTQNVTADVLRVSNGGADVLPSAPQPGNQWIGLNSQLRLDASDGSYRLFTLTQVRLVDGNDRTYGPNVIWRNALPLGELDHTVTAQVGTPLSGRLVYEMPAAVLARQQNQVSALRSGSRDQVLLDVEWSPMPGQVRHTYFAIYPD
jgi:hypothetical protein